MLNCFSTQCYSFYFAVNSFAGVNNVIIGTTMHFRYPSAEVLKAFSFLNFVFEIFVNKKFGY